MNNRKLKQVVMYTSAVLAIIFLVILLLPPSCPPVDKASKQKKGLVDTIIVTDSSGSMDDFTNAGTSDEMTKYKAAKEASLEIISIIKQENSLSRGNNKIGYVEFAGSASKYFNPTSSTKEIEDYLRNDGSRFSWGTNVGAGIARGLEILKSSESENKIMIVLSDGRSNTGLSNEEVLAELIPEAKEQGIRIFTIGFDVDKQKLTSSSEGVDPIFLYQIAKKSNGLYYYANKSLDLAYSFSNLYHQATGTVINSAKDSVSKDKPKIAKVIVPCAQGGLRLTVNSSSSSNLKIKLLDSTKKIINSDDKRLSIVSQGNFINAFYKNPKPGEWQVQVRSESKNDKKTDFYLSASVTSSTNKTNGFDDWISDKAWLLIAFVSLVTVALSCILGLYATKPD